MRYDFCTTQYTSANGKVWVSGNLASYSLLLTSPRLISANNLCCSVKWHQNFNRLFFEGFTSLNTVLCKSNANEIRWITVFVLAKCRANFWAIFYAMSSEITGKSSSLKRNFVEILCDISEGQTKKSLLWKFAAIKRNFSDIQL